MRHAIVFLAALFALRCATGPGEASPFAPAAVAKVELVSITPVAGSTIGEDTEIVASVNYDITNFKPGVDYVVAPLFAAKGTDATFSAAGQSGSVLLKTARGSFDLRYPIAQEWRSERLRHPVRMWIYVMERSGPRSTRVIGRSPSIDYRD